MCDAMWGQSYIKYLMANEEMVSGDVGEATDTSEASKHVDRCTLHASISVIHTEIKAGHKDMWKELDCFCKTVKRDMKAEFGNFLRRSWPEAHPVQTDRLRSTLSRNNLHIFGITGGWGWGGGLSLWRSLSSPSYHSLTEQSWQGFKIKCCYR